MLNVLWAAMILLGIAYGAATGRFPEVSEAALSSAKEAVTLAITMLGIMGLWSGIMEIATDAGILERMTRKMGPILSFCFRRYRKTIRRGIIFLQI